MACVALVVAGTALALRPPAQVRALMRGEALTPPDSLASTAFDTSVSARTASAAVVDSTAMRVTQAGSTTVARDSTSPDSAQTTDSLSPFDGGLRLRRAAMQATLRAAGDSAPVNAVPAATSTAAADAREVMLHVNRAHDFTRQIQLRGAGLELRTAFEEYRIFLTEHASAPQTDTLRRALQQALDDALATCQAARDSAAAHGARPFRCRHPAQTGILQEDVDSTGAPISP